MADELRIALLGTKHAHAAGKVEVLEASEDWRLVGAFEPDEAVRREREQQPIYAGVAWLTKEQILGDASIAAVAVEGEVSGNLALAHEAIHAGKHVHLDKPPGDDPDAFAVLLEEAGERGLIVQLGYMFRYNPAFQFLFHAQEDGRLGEVFFARVRMSTSIDAEQRRGLAEYRGGMMFELGCHVLDAVVRLLGVPVAVEGFLRHDAPAEDALADNTLAVFSFERAMAVVESAAMEREPFPRRRFEVYGTKGSIVIEPLEPPAVLACFDSPPQGHAAGWHVVEMPKYVRYVDDFRDLAACIRAGAPLGYPAEHDPAVQRALLQACRVIS
jgi:predicted dehydrogenase